MYRCHNYTTERNANIVPIRKPFCCQLMSIILLYVLEFSHIIEAQIQNCYPVLLSSVSLQCNARMIRVGQQVLSSYDKCCQCLSACQLAKQQCTYGDRCAHYITKHMTETRIDKLLLCVLPVHFTCIIYVGTYTHTHAHTLQMHTPYISIMFTLHSYSHVHIIHTALLLTCASHSHCTVTHICMHTGQHTYMQGSTYVHRHMFYTFL